VCPFCSRFSTLHGIYPLHPYVDSGADLTKVFYRVTGDDALGTFQGTLVSVNRVNGNPKSDPPGKPFRVWQLGRQKLDERTVGRLLVDADLTDADGNALPAGTYNFSFFGIAETGAPLGSAQPMPYITLLRPNGGDSWTIGQYQNIHWSRQNSSGNTVDIDYSTDNGTTWIRIANQTPDTGWYLWNVRSPATTTAKVRIRDHETPSMTNTSGAVFRMVSP
jgi:hypothetical protein